MTTPTGPTGPDEPEQPGGSIPPASQPPSAEPPGGYPPPPPPPSAYPPPAPPAPGEYGLNAPPSVGEAVNYGWQGFTKNIGPLVVIALIILAIQIALSVIGYGIDSYWGRGIYNVFTTAVGFVITVGLYRAALMILDGRKIVLGELFSGPAVVNYFLASLLAGIIIGVGFLLLFVPGVIAAFLLQFVGFAAVDRYRDGPVAALTHSFNVVKDNVGTIILFDLAAIGLLIVGALLCGVGLLVAWPVVLIAAGFMWRRFTNSTVATLA